MRAIAFDPSGDLLWIGKSRHRADNRQQWSSEEVAHLLYEGFYVRGGVPAPDPRLPVSDPVRRRHLLARLASHLPHRSRWDDGWIVRRREGMEVVVRKGVDLWVGREDCRGSTDSEVVPGARVSVRVPADLWDAFPGFLLVHGDALPSLEGPRTRLYLNLGVQGACKLLAATSAWNQAGLGFAIKVAADPGWYERCDTAVVVLERNDFPRACATILASGETWLRSLRPATPAFARPLIPGVAIADDPADGSSFGLHRCRQLAEGILRAHLGGARSLADRMSCVKARFSEDGLDLDALHLEQGGVEYDLAGWPQAAAHFSLVGQSATKGGTP